MVLLHSLALCSDVSAALFKPHLGSVDSAAVPLVRYNRTAERADTNKANNKHVLKARIKYIQIRGQDDAKNKSSSKRRAKARVM